jgi:hypothetical protein
LLGVSAASLKFAADFTPIAPAFDAGIRTVSQNCRTDFRVIPPIHRRQSHQNPKTAAANLTPAPQILLVEVREISQPRRPSFRRTLLRFTNFWDQQSEAHVWEAR